jgi:hypothetical protein
MVVNMQHEECITMRFSEGLGIFDKHYGYPEIDDKEIYDGATGKVTDLQGIHAHAGRNFFVPEGKEFSFDIDQCPYLHIAIKAEKDTDTCLFLMVHDQKPYEYIRRFVVIGKTPKGDSGCYDIIKGGFAIKDDGEWQEYDCDLRRIRDEYNYPNAGSIRGIQFFSRTGLGEHTFHFDELLFKQESKESFIVRGIVVTNVGVAAKGLKVIAVDKNPGKDVVLGETITDSSGNYTIPYKKEVLQKMGKQKADIEIKIEDPEEESKTYGTSSVHFNADKDEEINLVLQTKSVEKTSEYNQIISDLKPHIRKVSFKDLQENEERQDISYLANKTGWDARLVAMVSLADKYSAESGIQADFYHALFRAGVSTDADGLYRTNSVTVKKIWEKAVEENIIEASLKPTIEQNLAKFKESGRTHLLENAKPVGVSSLKELLGISLPDSSKQREFVELYYDHVGDMSSFWANAEAKFGEETADELQLNGKLGYLTVNNAELIGRLRSDKKVEKSPVDLIRDGLYKPDAWDTVLGNDIPVPKDMPGKTDKEKKSKYINYMVSMLKISYPTAVVAEMVHNNELPVKGDSNVKKEVYEFLRDKHDKFQIGAHPVEKFIKDNNIKLREDALNEVKRVQRVYQVSPSDKAMIGLLDNNLDSALTIVQYDEKEFIGKFGNDLGGEDVAKMTYAKAHQVHSTVLNIAISYLTYRTSPRLYAISGAKKNVNPRDPDLISYPTLEEIFGSMDYCTCGHCKSVLSPAAYLVDLLEFINLKKYDTDGKELWPRSYEKGNPIEVLLKRRPDIEHVQLTCENTNTILPYIDLVNEILEYYVVNHTLNDLYLFSWDKIPGNDTERFIEFLKRNFDIDWVKAENVEKIDDGKTIYASFENKSLSLRINGGKNRAILTIADGKGDEFIVKTENGKLNIYYDFKGHNVEEITSAELLASPQFVNDQAYTTLKDQVYPFNLPFNQPLSALRLYYDYVKVPLHEAMEKLRVNNNFDIPDGVNPPPYAWREIYNEFIGISQEEYKVLTTSRTKKLPVYFGEDENMAFNVFNDKLFNAKVFSRRTGITYNELIELIKTQFINPNSHLIPKLEKLRISFPDFKKYLFSWDEVADTEKVPGKEKYKLIYYLRDKLGLDWLDPVVVIIRKIDNGNTIKVKGRFVWPPSPQNYILIKFNDTKTKANLTISTDKRTDEFVVKLENSKLNIYNKGNLPIADIVKIVVNLPDEDFEKKIPADLDRSIYGGDVKKWVKDNYDKIISLVLLTPPEGEKAECEFAKSELRYSLPDNTKNCLKEIDYWRLLRFIRLWKKLGWTIEETDRAIAALYNDEFKPAVADNLDTQKQKLDDGFRDLVVKIAHVKKIKEKLNLNGKNSLIKLLALWSSIDIHGNNSLYKQTFLHSSILKIDRVFDENGYGEYLQNANEKIKGHLPAIRAAFNVTAEELSLILNDAGFDDNSPLSLENVSKIYRYSFLAKSSKLSIQEFMALKTMWGMSPFHELEDVHPSTLKFIELVQLIKQSDFKIETLSYFLQHEDVTGKASPSKDSSISLAKTLKDGLVRIEQEYKVEDDPTGEIAKSKMALVYENAVVDKFFGLLKGTTSYPVDYSHPQSELEQELKGISDKITYDHFQKRLIYQGVMTEGVKTNFENATKPFSDAIQKLYDMAQDDFRDFFDKYPDLKTLYDNYVASNKPETEKIRDILEDFLPSLQKKLKHLFIKQTLSSSLNVDLTILNELLEKQNIMHSIEQDDKQAIEDFLKLEVCGVSAQYFFAGNTTADPLIEARIDFSKDGKHLPTNPDNADAKISAVWKFYLEVPVNENYNYYIETHKDAKVKISIDEKEILINDDQDNGIWQNQAAIELKAGRLYRVELEIAKVKDKAILKWESKGIGRESIPVKYLYPHEQVRNFSDMYIRLLKAISIFERLGLKEKEIVFFSTASSFQIDGKGFLNTIPVTPNPDKNKVAALFNKLLDLLRYVELKKSLNVKDETLVTIFNDPDVKDESGESLLLKMTSWDKSSYEDLLKWFKWVQADLSDLNKFRRLNEAFEVVKKFGVPAAHLLSGTTNEPVPVTVRDIQNTLREKYDESVWLTALQPINDQLRSRQRDALVSYILHEMQKNPATKNIDTPDKLFEYFFIDVEMDPCMKTSRIKQANSTVQLFIQRCLMNLEPEVSPASIKADQWEWMKRYRVWEANRKIFLYPENWLEPELRDNKSPFFRDLESELLQADITDELAETALLNYLEKLDEVSKLEISGMYLHEDEAGNEVDDILHVFGRTTGASRKYYYRRYDGNWTPWERMDLDIEDNPILPVVWKNRLFLFWLNIVRKGPENNQLPSNTKAIDLTTKDINQGMEEKIIEINLSWSEYYNNKWQPRKTSDFNDPIKFREDEYKLMGYVYDEFNRENIVISSFFNSSELEVHISIHPYAWNDYLFRLFNKHSAPLKGLGGIPMSLHNPTWRRGIYVYEEKLNVNYECQIWYRVDESFKHEVLKKPHPCDIIKINHHGVSNIFEAPFFYQDKKHVFFVKPEESLTIIEEEQEAEAQFPEIEAGPVVGIPVGQGTHVGIPVGLDKPVGLLSEAQQQIMREVYCAQGGNRLMCEQWDLLIEESNLEVGTRLVGHRVALDNRPVNYCNERIGPIGSRHANLAYMLGKGDFEMIRRKEVEK